MKSRKAFHVKIIIMTRHVYGYKFAGVIFKTTNKFTKNSRNVKKVVSYLQKTSFLRSYKSFLIFGAPSNKFLINRIL